MYYEFLDTNGNTIHEHENKVELIRGVCEYYKEKAIDNENEEYEVVGTINVLDQFQDIQSSETFYECGIIRCGMDKSPYQQSEFI